MEASPTTTCRSIGYLIVNGKRVGLVHCDLEPGHDEERWRDPWNGLRLLNAEQRNADPEGGKGAWDRVDPTPHRAVLEWEDDEPELVADWPERYDADEPFDVEVGLEVPRDMAVLEHVNAVEDAVEAFAPMTLVPARCGFDGCRIAGPHFHESED